MSDRFKKANNDESKKRGINAKRTALVERLLDLLQHVLVGHCVLSFCSFLSADHDTEWACTEQKGVESERRKKRM